MAREGAGGAFRARVACMFVRLPVMALVAIVASTVLGTDRTRRAFTHEERRALGAELRKQDYEGARLIALRFAYRLMRDPAKARDVMDRVDSRLVRLGWDSAAISLPRHLCRLVWSQWTHAREVEGGTRLAEETYMGELRARFETEGDAVNLLWLEAALQQEGGLPDARRLAAQTRRTATEFYAAAKRRKRAVARILGAELTRG
ncbi:MAG TPA: hypothetical protein VK841_08365 [Polyangiaceae bacterium]|jgi:hypothetical protein|nr:hypothetical protein [Polyangiaceae bacterium]